MHGASPWPAATIEAAFQEAREPAAQPRFTTFTHSGTDLTVAQIPNGTSSLVYNGTGDLAQMTMPEA